MLNTDSKLIASLICLATAAIVADGAWTLFQWPKPQVALRALLDSELAASLHRNQVIYAALSGFGGLALAYLFNGWRDRAERRHVIERAERRDGGVLAREAQDIAAHCAAAAQRVAADGASVVGVAQDLLPVLAPEEHMLLSATPEQLARLGASASTAARAVRLDLGRLRAALLATGDGAETGAARLVTTLTQRAAASASGSSEVFQALAKVGPREADRVSQKQTADAAARAQIAAPDKHAPVASRLLPAA